MEKLVFADSFKKSVKGALKVPTVILDDPIFRLHYKATALMLLCFSILVSGTQFFGDPILCIQKDDVPEKLLNTYCWIEGTFTLPKALSKTVGVDVVYPGVEKYLEGDEVIEHAYYQWVCFVLFLQCLIFCLPHVFWKLLEGGRLRFLIQNLKNPTLKDDDRQTNYAQLTRYYISRRDQHLTYALKFIACEFLNFVIVVSQIYFIDRFLGGHFTTFGSDVVSYTNQEQVNRTDPMIRVFPRITKCSFHKFGSSGDVQKHDALCLLPLNILNEKIFVIMWFWFVLLACLDGLVLFYRGIIIVSDRARYSLLNKASSLTTRDEIRNFLPTCSYGDWFLLYLLADNVDNLHFREFLLAMNHDKVYFEDKVDYALPYLDRKRHLYNGDYTLIFKKKEEEENNDKKDVEV